MRHTQRVDVHFKPAEKHNLYLAAKTRGQSVSEYVREAVAQAIEVDVKLMLQYRTTTDLPRFISSEPSARGLTSS